MVTPIKNIVIVGGGTAGWITAARIASKHRAHCENAVSVTLIESPDIATVGVGEGTFPCMRNTLRDIGLSENEFITECDVAFKQGIKFVGWCNGQHDDYYYHLFNLPPEQSKIDLTPYWWLKHQNASLNNYASSVQFQESICEKGLAPKTISHAQYQHFANYAYHLDAGKFAKLLKKFSINKLGIKYIQDTVTGVNQHSDGDIQSLSTKQHGLLQGDLFVDCSGFASLLLQKTLGVEFHSKNDILFCDSAVVMQVPYANTTSPIASATITTAQEAGWTWDIGLQSRRGVGYVYSSAHSTDEKAQKVLRQYVGSSANKLDSRVLKFTPGYPRQFWKNNCVAVGLSGGFLEPLEATALSVVEASASFIAEQLPACKEVMPLTEKRFNEAMCYRWDKITDFLKMHYLLSERTDSDFWIDNRHQQTIPQTLQESLNRWRYQPPSPYDFSRVDEPFTWSSYQYVLYGMQFTSDFSLIQHTLDQYDFAQELFEFNKNTAQQVESHLPQHRELLEKVKMYGFQSL